VYIYNKLLTRLCTSKRLVAPWGWPRFKAETCSSEYNVHKLVQWVGNTNLCIRNIIARQMNGKKSDCTIYCYPGTGQICLSATSCTFLRALPSWSTWECRQGTWSHLRYPVKEAERPSPGVKGTLILQHWNLLSPGLKSCHIWSKTRS
jgi:hypothetical protein